MKHCDAAASFLAGATVSAMPPKNPPPPPPARDPTQPLTAAVRRALIARLGREDREIMKALAPV